MKTELTHIMKKVYWGGGTVSLASEVTHFAKYHVSNNLVFYYLFIIRESLLQNLKMEPSIS